LFAVLSFGKTDLPEFQIKLRVSTTSLNLSSNMAWALSVIRFSAIFYLFLNVFGLPETGCGKSDLLRRADVAGNYLHGLISSLILVVFPAFSELRDNRERLLNCTSKRRK
jgi:hypothetical protein